MNPYEDCQWVDNDDIAKVKSIIKTRPWSYNTLQHIRNAEINGRQRVHVLHAIQEKINEARGPYLEKLRGEVNRLTGIILDIQERIQEVEHGT